MRPVVSPAHVVKQEVIYLKNGRQGPNWIWTQILKTSFLNLNFSEEDFRIFPAEFSFSNSCWIHWVLYYGYFLIRKEYQCFGNMDVSHSVHESCLQSVSLCGSHLYEVNILSLKSSISCMSCIVELQKPKTSLSARMISPLQYTPLCWICLKFSFCALF